MAKTRCNMSSYLSVFVLLVSAMMVYDLYNSYQSTPVKQSMNKCGCSNNTEFFEKGKKCMYTSKMIDGKVKFVSNCK